MTIIPIREEGVEVATLHIVDDTSYPVLKPDWIESPQLSPTRQGQLYRRWLWGHIQRCDHGVCNALNEILGLEFVEFDQATAVGTTLASCVDWARRENISF